MVATAVPKTAYIFQRIIKQGMQAGVTHDGTKAAIKWFRAAAFETLRVDPQKMMETAGPFKRFPNYSLNENSVGKMYCFFYDAKWKDELPYWDRFPLIFFVAPWIHKGKNKGFYGVNLHYLPYYARAQFMDALYTIASNKSWDNTMKIKMSYQTLKRYSKFKLFKPCFKAYLWTHVRSSFMYIAPKEWDMALMLPTERFMKARKERVWRDSVLSVD